MALISFFLLIRLFQGTSFRVDLSIKKILKAGGEESHGDETPEGYMGYRLSASYLP